MTNMPDNLNPNPLTRFLNKPRELFTKKDIIHFCENNEIKMINFRYTGADGRLKTLNFPITSRHYLDTILSCGERVDGSSLFKYIEASSSDMYVVPRFSTAYVNPFTEIPTLDIMCQYFNKDGEPLESSPEYIMNKAEKAFTEVTGMNFEAMGELEYYVIAPKNELYPGVNQRGYHASTPFAKWEHLRTEALYLLSQCFENIKYAHSEVGNFSTDTHDYIQNEIEFLPTNLTEAAHQMIMAKWFLRMLGHKYGVTITFAPKISIGKAGSGLHVHTRITKNGKNMMINPDGKLSDTAKKAIAGYLTLAPSLTAFGNTNPTSYFRLVPHQEAPTNVCWGDRNRSVLVRVPLGWIGSVNMVQKLNPLEVDEQRDFTGKQTVEVRSPDGSADIYLLLAGLAVAARHGFEMDNALEYAEKNYVNVNIFHDEHKEKVKNLAHLPASCWESADVLLQQKDIYMKHGIFTEGLLSGIASQLKSFNDKTLRTDIKGDDELLKIVNQYFHCG